MRFFRTRSFAGALTLAIAVFPAGASACSCIFDVDPDEYLRETDVVFEGELISSAKTDGIETSATLRVVRPLKGNLGETITFDQRSAGMCAAQFKAGEQVRVVGYGDARSGYVTSYCSNYLIQSGDLSEEIYLRARTNRQHTLALTGSDKLPPNTALLRMLIRWLSDYRSIEEGLDAADRLLALIPGDREALLFKAEFLSALKQDADALLIAQVLLAKNSADREAERRRVFSLARLNRSAEIPKDWKDFSGLHASDVDFSGRRLDGVVFRDAQLFDADLSNASMRGADLSQAEFFSSDLSGADLSGADLSGALLHGSTFADTDLRGANLVNASAFSLSGSADGGGDFSGADLRGAIMTNAGFSGTSFAGADARGVVLVGSYIEGDLSNVDLSGADLRLISFGPATNWTGAKLLQADLRGATLRGATIAKADLTGAVYDDETVFPADFDPVAVGAKRVSD